MRVVEEGAGARLGQEGLQEGNSWAKGEVRHACLVHRNEPMPSPPC